MNPLIIVLVVMLLPIIVGILIYNALVAQKNRVDNGWAQIDTQLQRRYDLIPNLVETVKAYAKHEAEVFEKVARARAGMERAQTIGEKAEADNVLAGTLKTLFAVSEAYPELRANQNFKDLQVELTNTENKVAFARQYYNDNVARFNTAIEKFPHVIIAKMMNYASREFFTTSSMSVRETPKVSF